jgi:uncharacterized SAM-binding protein YcdF (DUF218 family)
MSKIADIALVHGAGYRITGEGLPVPSITTQLRVDLASRVLEEAQVDKVLVCGRSANGTEACKATEALVMSQALQEHGIPEDLILLEDSSVSTLGNIALGLCIAQAKEHESFIGITSSLHYLRAFETAKFVAPKSRVELRGYLSAPEPPKLTSRTRELAQRVMLRGFINKHHDTNLESLADAYEVYKKQIPIVSTVKRIRYKEE